MTSPTLLDPKREAELAERGFTTVRLFEAHEAAAIRQRIADLIDGRFIANHGGIYLSFLEGDGERKGVLENAATLLLVKALGRHVNGGRFHHGGTAVKAPGGGPLPIHHHSPVTNACFEREINCWCPLTDVDESSGALRVIPRSHHLLPFIRVPKGGNYFDSFSSNLDRYAECLPVKAGEAILFDNSLLHGSAPNFGKEARYAISVQIVPDAARDGLFLTGASGWLEFVEVTPAAAFDLYVRTGARPPEWRTVSRVRDRNRAVTEAEFRSLLAGGVKATRDVDPLDAYRPRAEKPLSKVTRAVRGMFGRRRPRSATQDSHLRRDP